MRTKARAVGLLLILPASAAVAAQGMTGAWVQAVEIDEGKRQSDS